MHFAPLYSAYKLLILLILLRIYQSKVNLLCFNLRMAVHIVSAYKQIQLISYLHLTQGYSYVSNEIQKLEHSNEKFKLKVNICSTYI